MQNPGLYEIPCSCGKSYRTNRKSNWSSDKKT